MVKMAIGQPWSVAPLFLARRISRWAGLLAILAAALLTREVGGAGSDDRRVYDLPADHAERSLKLFSQQSGRGVIVDALSARSIRTNVVKGRLTAQEAVTRMLAGTGLEATQDSRTGAFAVRPKSRDAGKEPSEAGGADDFAKR